MADKDPAKKAQLKKEVKSMKTVAAVLGLIGMGILFGTYYGLKNDLIHLAGKTKGSSIKTLEDKLNFTLKFLILPMSFVLIHLFNTMFSRAGNNATINPLSGNDHMPHLVKPTKILQNTVEQAFLSVVAQLTLLPYLSGALVVKVIPAMNILFFFGRIFFQLGYPTKRTLGFFLTFVPTVIAIGFSFYYFVQAQYSGVDLATIFLTLGGSGSGSAAPKVKSP